jgi:hypothetical protein
MFRNRLVPGLLLIGLAFCNDVPNCPPGDPTCNLLTLTLYGCQGGNFHSYYGPDGSTGTAIFPTSVFATTGGGYLISGRAPSSFGAPLRAFTVNAINEDQFALRMDTTGGLFWNTFLGGPGEDPGSQLPVRILESNGRIYVFGSASQTFGSNGDFPFQGSNKNWALSLLATSGELSATHFFGGALVAQSRHVATAKNGDLLLVGDIASNLTGTIGATVVPYSGSGNNAAVMRLSADGRPRWNTHLGGVGAPTFDGHAIAEAPDGSVYVFLMGNGLLDAGAFANPVNSPIGLEDGIIVKLDANGVYQRHVFLGSTATDKSRGLVVLGSGDIVVSMTTDTSFGTPIVAHSGPTVRHDVALVQVDSNLNLKWVTFFETGQTSANDFMDLTNLPDGGFAVTVPAVASTGTPIAPFNGGADAAVVRYNADGSRRSHGYIGGAATTEFGIAGAPTCDGGFVVAGIATGSFGRPKAAFPVGSNFGGFIAKVGPDLRLAQ